MLLNCSGPVKGLSSSLATTTAPVDIPSDGHNTHRQLCQISAALAYRSRPKNLTIACQADLWVLFHHAKDHSSEVIWELHGADDDDNDKDVEQVWGQYRLDLDARLLWMDLDRL